MDRPIDRVAVIGAGPAGLATAKYLAAEKRFSLIQVFEQRGEVGGVWNPTPHKSITSDFCAPRTLPSEELEAPVEGQDGFVSPLYDFLETNIPHDLMNYSDQKFPDGSSLFPKHAVVKEYLESYADDIRYLLGLSTQVIDMKRQEDEGLPRWVLTVRALKSGKESNLPFDAVAVCNGHYSDPFIPEIPGLKDFAKRYPQVITHSKFYQNPEHYKDKKCIIVGNAASGMDLSAQISSVCQQPIIVSEKISNPITAEDTTTLRYPEISEFLPERAVRFSNRRVEESVDAVVFCTGYLYSFPFLQSLQPAVVIDGGVPKHLWEHLFYIPDQTLVFLGIPQRIVPFPVSEVQAAVVARAWTGRISLPSRTEMERWEASLIADRGNEKAKHNLAVPRDVDYINRLWHRSMSAGSQPGLTNDGAGKIPPYWGEEKRWVRERFPMIKLAAKRLGERRHEIRSLEELGFNFAEWKLQQQQQQQDGSVDNAGKLGVLIEAAEIVPS